MKGIMLAGGKGTRLHPVTRAVSKQLLPIYDKPMIYYPLTTLMLAGIRDILVISTPRRPGRASSDSSGPATGASPRLRKPTQARRASRRLSSSARSTLARQRSALVLGDNIFFGPGFTDAWRRRRAHARRHGLRLSCSPTPSAMAWSTSTAGPGISIEEKPAQPRSRWAVTGPLLRRPGVSTSPVDQAVGARRARVHRPHPAPTWRPANSRGEARPRLCLARYRHAGQPIEPRLRAHARERQASRSPAPRRSPTAWATSIARNWRGSRRRWAFTMVATSPNSRVISRPSELKHKYHLGRLPYGGYSCHHYCRQGKR